MNEFEKMDAYFRAANYLSLGQLYLKDNQQIEANLAANNPLAPHYSEASEVAECILFLCDPASKPVTGTELVCDCGNLSI